MDKQMKEMKKILAEEEKKENSRKLLLGRLSTILNAHQDIEDAILEKDWTLVKSANKAIGSQLKSLLPG